MPAQPPGKTLWEMFKERVSGNGANLSFHNPLEFRVGALVPIAKGRPGFAGFDFSVKEIRAYVRRLGGQEFRFTDYVLTGVNTKTFDADEVRTVRLRAVPNAAGGQEVLLLELYDEIAFDPGFLEVLKDTTGVFEVTDDHTGQKDRFTRINGVQDAYEAAIMVIAGTNDDGTAPPGQVASAKLEYWDYWRDLEIGDRHATKKQFLFVEMNSDSGWFQLWRGEEFFL